MGQWVRTKMLEKTNVASMWNNRSRQCHTVHSPPSYWKWQSRLDIPHSESLMSFCSKACIKHYTNIQANSNFQCKDLLSLFATACFYIISEKFVKKHIYIYRCVFFFLFSERCKLLRHVCLFPPSVCHIVYVEIIN